MTPDAAASTGMKISATLTDTIIKELAKTIGIGLKSGTIMIEEHRKEAEDILDRIRESGNSTPEERDIASRMTCEFRKEYRAEAMAELRQANFDSIDLSYVFHPAMETPYMSLYHFEEDEEKRKVINKIANLYNEYDESLMHKTHRVKASDFSIESADSTRMRVTTINNLRPEEAMLLAKLIERRSREADIIEIARQDPELVPYYKDRKIPEHVLGDYAIEPMTRDKEGRMLYTLTCSENDRDAVIGILRDAKLTLAMPFASPHIEMYELESKELDKISLGIDEGREFTIADINNASHLIRVYKDGYSEISTDADGKLIKKDYEVLDPSELKHDIKNIMNTMAHPYQIDKKDIKPKDIVVSEEFQERTTAFAALEVMTDDAYAYSPKNFTRQFKVEITEQGGIILDAPEQIQPPVIATEDMEKYRKNEKIRQFIAQGLDPAEAKEVGDELDQYEFEKYSSFYHPEEEVPEHLTKEDRDSLMDIFSSSFAGIVIESRFPERQKEEEHSLGSKLQEIIGGDRGEGFGTPERERDE